LGTWIEVTNLRNGKSVIVKTNDRLHPSMRRVVDLTMAAARKLDFVSAGLTRVKVVVLNKHKKVK
jgi:rare lipoprotein A